MPFTQKWMMLSESNCCTTYILSTSSFCLTNLLFWSHSMLRSIPQKNLYDNWCNCSHAGCPPCCPTSSVKALNGTSGYATWFTAGGAIRIAHLWRHWWRHNSEIITDREKRRPPRPMKSSELPNGENHIALRQLLQNRKWRHLRRDNLGSRWKLQKNGSREF